jgi:hypothetical protein
MVIVAGTEIVLGAFEDSVTVIGVVPAGPLKVTVPVREVPPVVVG